MVYKRMPIPYQKLKDRLADARDDLQRAIEISNDLSAQIDESTGANRFSKIAQFYDVEQRKLNLRALIEKLQIQLEGARYDNEK